MKFTKFVMVCLLALTTQLTAQKNPKLKGTGILRRLGG